MLPKMNRHDNMTLIRGYNLCGPFSVLHKNLYLYCWGIYTDHEFYSFTILAPRALNEILNQNATFNKILKIFLLNCVIKKRNPHKLKEIASKSFRLKITVRLYKCFLSFSTLCPLPAKLLLFWGRE